MAILAYLIVIVFGAFANVQSIYDPQQQHDRVFYLENEISDSDENSIVTHGTTCPPNASGQFPYAMDCRQFLNCWNGRGTIQSCAPGTLFNPRSLECDHPSKVKCKSFDEFAKPSAAYTSHSTNGQNSNANPLSSVDYNDRIRIECPHSFSGLTAHPTICTKFLNCDHGKTVIQDCGPGTAFNAITKICDWPQNVNCGARSMSSGGNANLDQGHAGEGVIDVRLTYPGDSTAGQQTYQQNGYTGQGSYSNYGGGSIVYNAQASSLDQTIPNPSHHLSLGSNVKHDTTSFDQRPSTVNGVGNFGDYTKSYSSVSGTNAADTISGSSQIHINGAYASPSTSGATSTSYGSNSRAGKTEQNQIVHSHAGFDQAIINENQVLGDYEQNWKNNQNKHQSESSNNVGITIFDKQYGSSIYIHSAEKIKCKKEVTGLFVHPFDCSKFINCKNGRTHIQDCGPGTIFDAKTGECNWPRNVECDQKNPTEYFASHKGRYEIDEAAALNEHNENEGAVGKVYDEETFGADVESHTSQSTFSVGAFDYGAHDGQGRRFRCKKNATGLFPHPVNCRKFLHCDQGRTFIQDCGPGTAYNAELEVCDWPQNVDCGTRVYDETHTVDEQVIQENVNKISQVEVSNQNQGENFSLTNTDITTNGGHPGYDASNSYSQIRRHDQYQGLTTSANSVNTKVICQRGMTGLNEHPFNCAMFLNCDGGLIVVQNCAPGTLFNPIVKICDFPKNVDCGSRPLPTAASKPTYEGWNTQYTKTDGRDHRAEYPDEASNIHSTKTDVYDTRTQDSHYGVTGNQFEHNRTQLINHFSSDANQNGNTNINPTIEQSTDETAQNISPLIRHTNPVQFNFSDQNIDNLRKDQSSVDAASGIYNKHTKTQTTLNSIGSFGDSSNSKQHTDEESFKIPDMSQVPLSQYPGSKYPVTPLEPSTTHYNSTWWSNKKVSQGGDVQTDSFDFDSAHVASIWPSRKTQFSGVTSDSGRRDADNGTNIYFPPRVPKNFSTGREHIIPIYYRTTTTLPLNIQTGHSVHTNYPYNKSYYKPSTDKPFSPDAQTDYLPISDALKFLMRPYINKNTTSSTSGSIHQNHTKNMEEIILTMAEKNKNYRTDHTVSLEQDSLAKAHFDEANIKHPEPNSDDEIVPAISGTNNDVKSNTFHHDHQCNHYHPPHIAHKLPPNFQHTAEFHKFDRDRKQFNHHHNHHAQTDNSYAENANGDQSILGSNSHHTWQYHHRHHPYHHHSHNQHQYPLNPRDPNFQHDPNHPIHSGFHHNDHNHQHHPNGIPDGRRVESTAPDTTSLRRPNIDLRFGGTDGPTQPTQFQQNNDDQQVKSEVESVVPCNQFNCQNGLCIPFNKVCDGRNDCGNRLDEQLCDHIGYEVRLSDDRGRKNQGRVEVKAFGKWGYVCDDKFSLIDAHVLCRELGFSLGAAEVKSNSYYTPHESLIDGSETIFNMDEVNCQGNETSLKECDFSGWGVSDCNAEEVVGVICKVPVMKCPPEYWLCETSEECIPTSFMCDNVRDCADGTDESPQHCNATLEYRLVGGVNEMEGRVEVKFQDVWGTVCDDDFGEAEAYVLCKSLGYTGDATIVKQNFGKTGGPIWLDQVSCNGNETALDKCMHFDWGETNCNHAEDVGVRCSRGVSSFKSRQRFGASSDEVQELSAETQQYLNDLQRNSKNMVDYSTVCGQIKVTDDDQSHNEPGEFRVIRGSRTKRGYHPWQATLRAKGRNGKSSHWCGAVIISKFHILTAAHCLIGFPKGAYLIRVGDHHSEIPEDSEVEVFIDNWYIHEDFRKGQHMNNDIAVVLLKSPIQFTNYIQPVCLPTKESYYEPGRSCAISGWGSVQYGKSTPSLDLKSGSVPIIDQNVCKRNDIYGDAIMDGMFCAGYLGQEGVDACDGDSGGPFVCQENGVHILYGIISWGQRCGDSSKPGVYVKVSQYLDWIQEKVNLLTMNRRNG